MSIILTANLADWLSQHSLACPYMKFFGIPCPGCGIQRAFTELLRGHLWESLRLYPALIPLLFLLTFLILHLIFKFRNGAAVIKYSFIGTAGIVIFHYIYLLITVL
ncbi:MAG: DUF2752 domain-containing protein [Bacteroidales bacterium]|nr:DUF2752 domain-containing protein [Bacteroidales bacterium]